MKGKTYLMEWSLYIAPSPVTLVKSHVILDINLMVMMFKIVTLEYGPQNSIPVNVRILICFKMYCIYNCSGGYSDITLANGSTTMLGSQLAIFECDKGFHLDPPLVLISCKDGMWSPTIPICSAPNQ